MQPKAPPPVGPARGRESERSALSVTREVENQAQRVETFIRLIDVSASGEKQLSGRLESVQKYPEFRGTTATVAMHGSREC